MKSIIINKRVNLVGKVLLAVAFLIVIGQSAFAVTDRTWITNASGGQIASGGNCKYIVYYKGSDDYLQTEDSWNAVPGYANSNAGYFLSGSPAKGYCDTNSSYYPDPDPASTDTYDIWISSVADSQAGHGSGTVGAVSPSYVPAGNSNAVPLALSSGDYLAMPGNFKVSSGNGRVVVSWDAVAGATGYKVYRGPVGVSGSGTGIYQRVADTSSLAYEDASVTNGTTYYYIVFAYDASRRGVHTDQLSAIPDTTAAPSITLLNPTSGSVGSSVTISGSGFGATKGTGFVMFNGLVAAITSWGNTSIVATVPTGATTGNVVVINSSGRASAGVNFTVSGGTTPTVTGVAPSNGSSPNTGITITGTNFTGVTSIVIGTTPITTYTFSSDTSITGVSIPAGLSAGAYDIRVTTPAGQSPINAPADRYTVNAPAGPTVTGIAPSTGLSPNTDITITGTNFTGVTSIVIGTTPITTYTYSSATSITGVSIPAGLVVGAYDIRVTTPAGQSPINAPADQYTVTTGGGGKRFYEKAGGIMMAYPNPFNPNDPANPPGGLQMLFNAATGEAVDIYIFDTNARVIYQNKDRNPLAADRTVTWDGETSYGETVENGLYLIRVVKDGKLVAKGKILVIKK